MLESARTSCVLGMLGRTWVVTSLMLTPTGGSLVGSVRSFFVKVPAAGDPPSLAAGAIAIDVLHDLVELEARQPDDVGL